MQYSARIYAHCNISSVLKQVALTRPRMAVRVGGPGLLQRLRALAAANPAAGARCLSDAAPGAVGGRLPADGRTLQDFIRQGQDAHSAGGHAAAAQGTGEHTAAASAAASPSPQPATAPSLEPAPQRTAFVETYGCESCLLSAGMTGTVSCRLASPPVEPSLQRGGTLLVTTAIPAAWLNLLPNPPPVAPMQAR